jgi:hypothetical protein
MKVALQLVIFLIPPSLWEGRRLSGGEGFRISQAA